MISPGLEPGTTSVLDWCDNQLHHETMFELLLLPLLWMVTLKCNWWDVMKCKPLISSSKETGEGVAEVCGGIKLVLARGASGHMIGSRRMDTAG